MSPDRAPGPLTVVVDDREPRPGLAEAMAALGCPVAVARLPVGDVEIGTRVLVERKTVADFVASLADGRLFDQSYALRGACARPLLVIEGEEPWAVARVSPASLRRVLVMLLVGYGVPVLRTGSLAETAQWIAAIAVREERRLARLTKPDEPREGRVAMDLLGAIPGVGDCRARRLLECFGSAGAVLAATEDDLGAVPTVGPATARAIREAAGGGAEPSRT